MKISVSPPGTPCGRIFSEGTPSDFQTLLDGILLGDGSITLAGSLRVSQSSKRLLWLWQLERRLRSFGCEVTVVRTVTRDHHLGNRIIPGNLTFLLYSKVYQELKEQRRRWYPDGKKAVPADLVLTPEGIAHWFTGDGFSNGHSQLGISTEGFSVKDIDRLVSLMPVKARRSRSKCNSKGRPTYHIKISQIDEAWKLARLIRRFMPICARYKLAHVRKKIVKFPPRVHARVRRMRAAGATRREIVDATGMSLAWVDRICKMGSYNGT